MTELFSVETLFLERSVREKVVRYENLQVRQFEVGNGRFPWNVHDVL
tara:strand:+ start:2607 stop:2747 length:141 start_codon:yes stop_codon:yes gene_type:complete